MVYHVLSLIMCYLQVLFLNRKNYLFSPVMAIVFLPVYCQMKSKLSCSMIWCRLCILVTQVLLLLFVTVMDCFWVVNTCSLLHLSHFYQLKGSVKEPNMFDNYSTEKITRKASDAAENLQFIKCCSVLPPEIVMYDAFNVILWTSANICVVHHDLGWKNRTRYNCSYFCCVTGFTSDCLGRNNRML